MSILTASNSDQHSAESDGRGLFSTHLQTGAVKVLGHVGAGGLHAYLPERFGAWDQWPTFEATVDRLHNLHTAFAAACWRSLGTQLEAP